MVKQLPLWGKIIYGVGAGGFNLIDRILITYLMYYYVINPIRGEEVLVTPLLFGIIMFLGRTIDAIADPLIARWSDNLSSPRGRRIPFMLYSSILYVGVFIALFYPPIAGKSPLNDVYLAIFLGLYFALFTAYVCPYLALLPELARTHKDRVDLATWKAVFSILGVAVAFIGGGLIIDALSPHGMVWIMGALGLLLLYTPILIRERDYAETEPATLGLVEALKTTFTNKPFSIYLAANVTFWLGFNIVTLNLPAYVQVLMGGGEGDIALFFGAVLGVAFILFPFINFGCKKFGLKAMMMVSLVTFMIFLPFIFFMGQEFIPGISADMAALILMGFMGIPVAAIFVVPDAIVAAVSDLEEKLTGQRREGMYFGAQGFVMKLAMGISTVITGGLLEFFGSTVEQPLGIQLTGPVAAAFILVGVIFFTRYPEKEVNRAHEEATFGKPTQGGAKGDGSF